MHFATEPVTIGSVAREAFGIDFHNVLKGDPAVYDVHTIHATVFNRSGPYMATAGEVLDGMTAFVASVRQVRQCV